MIVSGIALAIVALLGWVWLARGFFSAFLNLICCIAAGAIAFAVWEPIAYLVLGKLNGNDAWGSATWAFSLALPFAVSMAILRAIVDKCTPANVKFDAVTNAVGGGVCGAMSGIITAGILIISMGFLRVDRDFLGYTPIEQQANGTLQVESSLMFPVDKMTAGLYKFVSNGTLASADPLARWYPDLVYVPGTMRISYGDGKARNTINIKDFDVWTRFTVGGKDTQFRDLLADEWNRQPQDVKDTEGEAFPSGTRLEGFVLNFQPSARERSGSVVIGNGQVRLLLEKAGEAPEYKTVYPITILSQAATEKRMYARFRFDAPETFISSVGGASETQMGFEFPVPPGYEPIALYVKNSRVAIPADKKPTVFASAAERDQAVDGGAIFREPSEGSSITEHNKPRGAANAQISEDELGVRITAQMGFVIQSGIERSMRVDGSNVVEGHEIYEKSLIAKGSGAPKELRIEKYQTKPDIVIVQIDVTNGQPLSWVGKVSIASNSQMAAQLVDTDGQAYEPIGYVYEEHERHITVHFNRSQPLRNITDIPMLSQTRQDQKLKLIFDVSKGVKLAQFRVGSTTLHTFKPPMPTVDR